MFRKYIATAVLTMAGLFSQQVSAEDLKELNFGIISTDSQQNLRPQWDPFLKDMEKQLGIKVNPFFASDYAGIIQAMRFNKVDVAWYGNAAAIEAVDRADGEVFAKAVNIDGNPGYWSTLIVNKDSPYHNLDDVINNRANMTFGNGDPNSTSGFLVPAYYVFAVNNIKPSEFKRSLNSNHETNALLVANKKVDVATNNTESLDRIKENYPEKFDEIRVIWTSPLIPGDPIVWRKGLSDDDKAKIKNFFLTYGTQSDDEKKVLQGLSWSPFVASDDNQLLPVRQIRLFKTLTDLENNDTLSADEKKNQMAELQKQLKAIDDKMKALGLTGNTQ